MTDTGKDDRSGNQGEGNRAAARHYNEAQKKFVEKGQVKEKAEEAERALKGKEGEELRRAEEEGKSHAKGHDPEEKRSSRSR